jgi:hypothetical protein
VNGRKNMNKLQFRFKIIKFLGKIEIHIPLKARMKLSKWITNFVGLFIKFDPIKKIEIPKLIEHEGQGYYNGDEWIDTSEE